ncbi:hypothetical protein RHMOL_Rhmol07G0312400 [Rhododendron molle]|uniref:Uncharacterized protein n=1 Tax=Rhododendron molle TaxID=49168 RepID=A0ACC0N8M3_RHOML|nr:hypothetical protein RHMOL_Rhmol07G0312400 [Rhododendron molle]
MRSQVSVSVEGENVQEGMRDLLLPLQLRAAGDFRQPSALSLLLQHDYPWRQAQVPLETYSMV